MLASFLAGITLGSGLASRFATDRDRAARGLAWAQLGTALLSVGVYYGFAWMPNLVDNLGAGEQASGWQNLVIASAVLLPAALCIGATFPFAVRVLARDQADAGPASARVYAWNTAGAITGAALAGFVLLPRLAFEGVITVAVTANVVLAAAALLLGSRPPRVALAAVAALAVLSAGWFHPAAPESVLRCSPLPNHPRDGRLEYYGVGRSATVLLLERDGAFELRSNGNPEATIRPRGSFRGLESARWLTALPVLARPEAESVLIVGFGGGLSVAGVPPSVASIDVVEIEPEILEANRRIADRRLEDPLADPRLRVLLNDARGALAVSDVRYDAIVSQPSHSWTAGASHLYTREFMAEARDHLRPGGVFVQWMNARFVDEALFRTLGATLLDVYQHVRVYAPDPWMLLFLASDEAIEPEAQAAVLAETDHFRAARCAHSRRAGGAVGARCVRARRDLSRCAAQHRRSQLLRDAGAAHHLGTARAGGAPEVGRVVRTRSCSGAVSSRSSMLCC